MTATPRNRPRALPVVGTAIAIAAVIVLADRLIGASGHARPQLAAQTTAGTAAEKSTPAPKERVRYQATIENWRRYRATNAAEAH